MTETRSRGRGKVREETSQEQKPGISTSSDAVSTDKQQKEALLEEKIRKIKEKNEQLLKRKQEIENDIKYANVHSEEVAHKTSQQGTEHKMAGVRTEAKPVITKGRARGRLLAKMSRERPRAHLIEERQRRQNYIEVEREMKEEVPEKGSSRSGNFLADDRRVDMSKAGSRSSHSWGGNQFDDVVERISKKERGFYSPPRGHQNLEVSMTGRERKEYLDWKEERIRVDEERKERQKREGGWKREWDHGKDQGRRRDPENAFGYADKDRSRGGQRFGHSHWSYHDDRGSEADSYRHGHGQRQHDNHGANQEAPSEDWGDALEQVNSSQQNTSAQSVPIPEKEEDWEESCVDVKTPSIGAALQSEAVASNETVEWGETTEERPVDTDRITEKKDKVGQLQSSKSYNNNVVVNANVKDDITVSINTDGEREVKSSCMDSRSDIDHTVTETDESHGAENPMLDQNVEEPTLNRDVPKPQREQTRQRHHIIQTVGSSSNTKCALSKSRASEQEDDYIGINPEYHQHFAAKDNPDNVLGEAFGMNQNKLSSDIIVKPLADKAKTQNTESQGLETIDTVPMKESGKEKHHHLPNLIVKPQESEEEPVPDFLKTPKDAKTDWGDCEFDEEKLESLPIQWGN